MSLLCHIFNKSGQAKFVISFLQTGKALFFINSDKEFLYRISNTYGMEKVLRRILMFIAVFLSSLRMQSIMKNSRYGIRDEYSECNIYLNSRRNSLLRKSLVYFRNPQSPAHT